MSYHNHASFEPCLRLSQDHMEATEPSVVLQVLGILSAIIGCLAFGGILAIGVIYIGLA